MHSEKKHAGCPWCGCDTISVERMDRSPAPYAYYAVCENCLATGPVIYADIISDQEAEEEALVVWDKRSSLDRRNDSA